MSKLVKVPRKVPAWLVWARRIGHYVSAQAFFAFLWLVQRLPADAAIGAIGRAARAIGMRYPRTRLARRNLQLAFPEKSPGEIEEILGEMWENLGRTAAEYAYLDQIFDFDDRNPSAGRFEIAGIPEFAKLKDLQGPAICFTAHTANWELLPVASAAYGVNVTALFRPPNNPFIARRVLSARRTAMGHLVPSKAGAAFALADILRDGGKVGLLVDQYYARGVEVEFFGRKTLANPLLARLVRQFDCPVYPARTIRLKDGRFRIELQAPLEIPRDDKGRPDVDTLTRMVNATVESWIRENPGQWLWLHKRWR
jgi:KDO2-lipid IV(A) lauroyltransferase